MTEAGTPSIIRVGIADDQTLLRQTLRLLIDHQPDMQAKWEADSGMETLALVRDHRPDVLLLDIRMPGLNGLDTLRRLRADKANDSTRVLMLTMYDLDDYVRQALTLGANGFLLKDSKPDQILEAIRRVGTEGTQLSPAITQSLIERFINSPGGTQGQPAKEMRHLRDALTPREQEVLHLVGQGYSNEEIMDELVISKGTIKSHIASLRRKTNARDRVHLAMIANDLGRC